MRTFLPKAFPGFVFGYDPKGDVAQFTVIGIRAKYLTHAIQERIMGARIGIIDKQEFLGLFHGARKITDQCNNLPWVLSLP